MIKIENNAGEICYVDSPTWMRATSDGRLEFEWAVPDSTARVYMKSPQHAAMAAEMIFQKQTDVTQAAVEAKLEQRRQERAAVTELLERYRIELLGEGASGPPARVQFTRDRIKELEKEIAGWRD